MIKAQLEEIQEEVLWMLSRGINFRRENHFIITH